MHIGRLSTFSSGFLIEGQTYDNSEIEYPKSEIKMTRLSVNINKIATLRNSRGGNNPDLVTGSERLRNALLEAQGVTVHSQAR